jgi:signal transduction histidine kinase
VLAHSLSGAAIQLQGARKLGERHGTEPQVRAAIDRASELVRDGLTQARSAVGALRGDALPTVSELQSLVESFRDDMHVDVSLSVDGDSRALPAEASLALYRGAQEALTNVARYAPGATACVSLRYGERRTQLTIDNSAPTRTGGLPGVGGGRGLEGLRERIEGGGGSMEAGPLDGGWRVRLEIPA